MTFKSNLCLDDEFCINLTNCCCVYYLTSIPAIGGRMTFTANDEHDVLDGDLVVRVSIPNILCIPYAKSDLIHFSILVSEKGSTINEFNRFTFTTNWL